MVICKNKFRLHINEEFIYILAFGLYFFAEYYRSTMFFHTFPTFFLGPMKAMATGLLILKCVIHDQYKMKRFLTIASSILLSLLITFKSEYAHVFSTMLFIISAQGVNFDNMLKCTLYIGLTLTVISVAASQVGIIPDLVYYRDNGSIRHSFGTIYPTDFAAHIFYLALTFFYLQRGKLCFKHVCVLLFLIVFLDVLCDTRLTELQLIFLLFAAFLYKKSYIKERISLFYKIVIPAAMPVCAFISIMICKLYDKKDPTWKMLNSIVSRRLEYGNNSLNDNKVNLFGRFIEQNGSGGTVDNMYQRNLEYTFIDISYMRVLLMYGLVMFVIVLTVYPALCVIRMKKGDLLLPMCFFVIAVSSMIDHHLIDFAYNTFILCLLMNKYNPVADRMIEKAVPKKRRFRIRLKA